MNYTYILKLNDNSYYTGWTNNLSKRLSKHNSGKGAKCTRAKLPAVLVYFEEFETKSEAMKREYVIKQLSHYEKEKLVDSFQFNQKINTF